MSETEKHELTPVWWLNPQALIEKAIETQAPVDALERLVALAERVQAQTARSAWFDAMAQFQRTCPVVHKTKTATMPKYQFKYAPLSEVMAVVAPVMAPLGLSLSWRTRIDATHVYATAIVSHTLGHREESGELAVPLLLADPEKGATPPQRVGIALAYAKRYTANLVLGIAPVGDEEAGAPTGPAGVQTPQRAARPEPEEGGNAIGASWQGKVKSVTKKSGKKQDGTPWTLYTVTGDDGSAFGTFSTTDAEVAEEAHKAEGQIIIDWSPTDRGNRNIVGIRFA